MDGTKVIVMYLEYVTPTKIVKLKLKKKKKTSMEFGYSYTFFFFFFERLFLDLSSQIMDSTK